MNYRNRDYAKIVVVDEGSDHALLRVALHQFCQDEWKQWYPRVAELLQATAATARAAAVERLSMAVFRAEASRLRLGVATPDDALRRRAEWLVDSIERVRQRHPDVALRFLDALRFHGDGPPFPDVLLPWLHGLQEQSAPGVPPERIQGAILLIGGLEPWEGSLLPPILDHPSDHVRACAAHALGRAGHGLNDDDESFDPAFIAELTAKELKRPGIAGPWWSALELWGSDLGGLAFDALEWMLGIVEQRRHPEPGGLPFNGVDFYVRDLAAGNPAAVSRLSAAERDS